LYIGLTVSCMLIGSTVHADIPPRLCIHKQILLGVSVRTHVMSSIVGSKNLTDDALRRYGADWPGLLAKISDTYYPQGNSLGVLCGQ
jgi:hypothetical protein